MAASEIFELKKGEHHFRFEPVTEISTPRSSLSEPLSMLCSKTVCEPRLSLNRVLKFLTSFAAIELYPYSLVKIPGLRNNPYVPRGNGWVQLMSDNGILI